MGGHVHAVWLAKTVSLGNSIDVVININISEELPLEEEIRARICFGQDSQLCECRRRRGLCFGYLCGSEVEDSGRYTDEWFENTLRYAAKSFDEAFL